MTPICSLCGHPHDAIAPHHDEGTLPADCPLCNGEPEFVRSELPRCEATGKIIYSSPGAADKVIAELRRRKNERGLHTYRCDGCRRWHVGHAIEAST